MRITSALFGLITALVAAGCESYPTRPTPLGGGPIGSTAALNGAGDQAAADAISENIQRLHLVAGFPYATIVDPRFASNDPAELPAYTTVVDYVHAGDAAIWTGHYLAAESFRFAVTGDPAAFQNAQRALDGIQGLVDVTTPARPDLLARFLWPTSWEYNDQMARAEGFHGVYEGSPGGIPHRWLGNTSRDQYSGVFFGLAVAYDYLDSPKVRHQVKKLVTRMLNLLIQNGWNVPMPDGSYNTTFLHRPDQQLALLQIGRHVNRGKFETLYVAHRATHASEVILPMLAECQDQHGSYYKFNLDHINLYNLIRLEEAGPARDLYVQAFATLRGCTGAHENAHFATIESAISGPDAARDDATAHHLALWLERPRRDYYVDFRPGGTPATCNDDRGPAVIPVNQRVNTDFLWQRSPFLLCGGGNGTIETAAIDYLLPYWMGRYYHVLTQ